MSISYNKVAALVFDCFNKRDFSPLQNFLNENMILNFPGIGDINGSRKAAIFMNSLLRKYPKLFFSVTEIIVDKESAVVVWTNKGENATGELYENSGMTLFHFRENKIVLISDYFKDTSFMN